MKKYVIVAGVNVDEIVRKIGDWKNFADVISAGKIAVKMIEGYFERGSSFNQETTLCGRTIIKNIREAKKLGYFIELHYIGLDSVEIAKQRVAYRVQQGGHGVAVSDIEKRYEETFKQLNFILSECDLIAFYDNTEKFRRFAICKNGELVRISQNVPEWFSRVQVNKQMM